ncbi:ATP-binding protein [Pseudonocardia sp. EC080610-09]|uniref:ATP-dependent sacrificial sulfur transferase LarE n=1 Tax=unclassified Pseudonocardia TaxID=2619320 RepID=UPI0006CB2101|nr:MULTISPECIES: ATP-dependent sacrificial sulfur transferase LarE [unclassified Pseudonocardia]ALE73572.1 ATP-binding protein [Pseudonocardia sp. EC080625-04]ALL76897.1 ATP-binding protein [Pseudonocardia sp. EC080610-09]ALL83928.1 ATP-binding protein [Pseudonocardia sp. EC080619-01]
MSHDRVTDGWRDSLGAADRAAAGRVGDELRGAGRVGVALSGGVDSSTLLALAADALGPERVRALVGVSASLAADERATAHRVAAATGVELVEVATAELDRPDYRANGPDRCYACRDTLFTTIDETVLAEHDLDVVAYGENLDDTRRADRPGARAATEHGVLRPLASAGLDKPAVRRIARAMGLPNADKPAAPCLASRIPHFEQVTEDKMAQIERAERAVRALGFDDVRVRHHGEVARVELSEDLIADALGPRRTDVLAAVRDAGFRFVTVDLAGLQSGAFTLPLVSAR